MTHERWTAGVPPASGPEGRTETPSAHRGWHGRGYLPHFDHPERVQHITFRLHGSLPRSVLERLDPTWDKDQRRAAVHHELDRGHGPRWLAEPGAAAIVAGALRHFDGERYRLLAWCVMSNHVHVVAEQIDGWPLPGVVHAWKSYTAKVLNSRLGLSGAFWAADYFDRYVRDEGALAYVIDYVEQNPVKAGLCQTPDQWPWSSARS